MIKAIISVISYVFLINFVLVGFEMLFSQYAFALRDTFLFARYNELKSSFAEVLKSMAGIRLISVTIAAAITMVLLKVMGVNPFESSQIASCGSSLVRPAALGHGSGSSVAPPNLEVGRYSIYRWFTSYNSGE